MSKDRELLELFVKRAKAIFDHSWLSNQSKLENFRKLFGALEARLSEAPELQLRPNSNSRPEPSNRHKKQPDPLPESSEEEEEEEEEEEGDEEVESEYSEEE